MSDHYVAVFEALDAAVASNACLASSDAQIQRSLAYFRDQRTDAAAIEQLETASIELHRLSMANFANRRDERAAALRRLRKAAEIWMHRLPLQ